MVQRAAYAAGARGAHRRPRRRRCWILVTERHSELKRRIAGTARWVARSNIRCINCSSGVGRCAWPTAAQRASSAGTGWLWEEQRMATYIIDAVRTGGRRRGGLLRCIRRTWAHVLQALINRTKIPMRRSTTWSLAASTPWGRKRGTSQGPAGLRWLRVRARCDRRSTVAPRNRRCISQRKA